MPCATGSTCLATAAPGDSEGVPWAKPPGSTPRGGCRGGSAHDDPSFAACPAFGRRDPPRRRSWRPKLLPRRCPAGCRPSPGVPIARVSADEAVARVRSRLLLSHRSGGRRRPDQPEGAMKTLILPQARQIELGRSRRPRLRSRSQCRANARRGRWVAIRARSARDYAIPSPATRDRDARTGITRLWSPDRPRLGPPRLSGSAATLLELVHDARSARQPVAVGHNRAR